MKKFSITFPLAIAVIFSMAAVASAVSFYPLPGPVEKGVPKAERAPSNAVGIYSASWEFTQPGQEPEAYSGTLVSVESSVGEDYVVGGAFNSLEGNNTVWELHVTRRLPKGWGIQAGGLYWDTGYTDWELLATKSFRGKGPKQPWAADVGFGYYYWDDVPGSEENAGTAFVSGSWDVSKNITANLSVWSIALEETTVTRTTAGVGYRF